MSYDQREYLEPYSYRPYGAARRVWRLLYPVFLFFAIQGVITGIVVAGRAVSITIELMGGSQAIASGVLQPLDYNVYLERMLAETADLAMPALAISSLVSLVVFGLMWRKTRGYMPQFERPDMNKTAFFGVLAVLGGHALITVFAGLLMQNQSLSENYQKVENLVTSGSLPLRLITLAIIGPIVEEFIFRGILINRAVYWMPKWAAVVVSAFIFGAMHGNVIQGLYAFLGGLMLGYIYIKTRNIIAAIAAHIVFNIYDLILNALAESIAQETLAAIALTGMLVSIALGVIGAIQFIKAKPVTVIAAEDGGDALPPPDNDFTV
jgi:membrane protease YdiL (CAAX protease family)